MFRWDWTKSILKAKGNMGFNVKSVQSNFEIEGHIARMGIIPGLLYVAETQTGRVFSMRFGNFSGYRGQTAEEFGLRPGAHIRFRVSEDRQTVASATILK